MKIQRNQNRGEQGSLLLTCVIIATLIGVALASYLILAETQNRSIYRSQSWNSSIPLTEAGTEEALALINKYSGTSTTLESWTNSALLDGWSSPEPSVYYTKRFVGPDFYEVYITNLNDRPTIKSAGTVQWTYQYASATSPTLLAAIGANPLPITSSSRAVLLTTGRNSPFTAAILVKKGITLSGGIVIDSFNSQDPNYSTNGQYIASKHKAGGDIATLESNVVAAVTGSGAVRVYGQADTGPNSTVTTSGNAAIGSLAWISGNNRGVEPGWSRSDVNVVIPDQNLPSGIWLPSAGFSSFLAGGSFSGTNYTYLISPVGGSGSYQITGNPNLSGSQSVCVNGQVSLYFTTGVQVSGQAYIYITPGSTLKMYFGGSSSISGGGVVNGSSFATNCACFGLPGCTSLAYSGGSCFVGTINAPEANVALSGGGSSGMNFVGSVVANSLNVSGNYSFHYDESLAAPVEQPFYYVTSWTEVHP